MSVRAMKAGAIEFLTKPVRHQELLDAIQAAIERDRVHREQENDVAAIRGRELTQRERQVMALVVAGRPNKQIAAEMGFSMTTVKLYRGQLCGRCRRRRLPSCSGWLTISGVPDQTYSISGLKYNCGSSPRR